MFFRASLKFAQRNSSRLNNVRKFAAKAQTRTAPHGNFSKTSMIAGLFGCGCLFGSVSLHHLNEVSVTTTSHAASGISPSRWPNTTVLDSPAITVLFTSIRNVNTTVATYINDADRLMRILAEEGLARVKGVKPTTVETPCGLYEGLKPVPENRMCAVSIVRSGDILLEAVRACAPNIKVGKILCQRDESHPDKIAKLYYSKFPKDIADLEIVILVDPMLATGGSAMLAIDTLLKAGVKEERILFLNVVSCPEGLDALGKAYPKIQIVTAAVDSHLNEDKYIVPGLGDFGDRYYSTE